MESSNLNPTINAAMLERLLAVTRKLALPFELTAMLTEVIDAGRVILNADRGSVFLFDQKTDELYTIVATGVEGIRFPADRGIVGQCAKSRRVINVPDCYADPRFNRDVDRATGYHTRCLLTVPMVAYDDSLVGVLQVLNKLEGVFTSDDERMAEALAAQCGVALQRVGLIANLVRKEKIERELAIARDVQMRVFPMTMPQIPGYDVAGWSRPAEETGGDIFDLITLDTHRLMMLMGDATGHGLGPALSVTQVRAMLRMGLRLGGDLDGVFVHINDQLVQDLAENRFVTAVLGELDAQSHTLTYHAGGQGPLLHYHAAAGTYEWREATTFPMGMMELFKRPKAEAFNMEPGDIVAFVSDGIFEYPDAADDMFGTERFEQVLSAAHTEPMADVIAKVVADVERFGTGVAQPDDMTILLVSRLPA